MFSELYEQEHGPTWLGVFESVPGRQEVDDFVWDTSVPELDAPWPHHMPEDLGLRDMVAWLSGRPDATNYLYELSQLDKYERELDADVTALMDVVMA